jgi:predicted phage-related endonuclease
MGLCSWQTPLELYYEKLNPQPRESSEKVEMGKRIESFIAELFTEATGYPVHEVTKKLQSEVHPWLVGYIDREIEYPDGEQGILEIKNSGGFASKVWNDGPPPYYVAQWQGYAHLTGIDSGYICVLIDGHKFRMYEMDRDDEYIDRMLARASAFYEALVSKTPPPPVNEDDLALLHPEHQQGVLVPGDDVSDALKEYARVSTQLKELETQKKALQYQLKEKIADAEGINYGGRTVVTYKKSRDGEEFDHKRFCAENPDIAKEYMRTRPGFRRFLFRGLE